MLTPDQLPKFDNSLAQIYMSMQQVDMMLGRKTHCECLLQSAKINARARCWSVVEVKGLDFFYTVGLTGHGLPELVLRGNLRGKLAKMLLNIAAMTMVYQEEPFEDFAVNHDIAEELPTIFAKIPKPVDFPLTLVGLIYQDYKVMQMLWPDASGRFEWQQDFDPRYVGMQDIS